MRHESACCVHINACAAAAQRLCTGVLSARASQWVNRNVLIQFSFHGDSREWYVLFKQRGDGQTAASIPRCSLLCCPSRWLFRQWAAVTDSAYGPTSNQTTEKPQRAFQKKKGKRSGNVKWAAATLTFSLRILRSGSNLVLFHASVISILNVQALMEACHYVSAACLLFSHSIYSRLLESAPACTTSPKAL